MVRGHIVGLAASGLMIAAGAGPAGAQIVNGSFETGLAYGSGLSIFSAGTPAPWVATSFTPDLYDNTGADGWGIGGIPQYDNMFKGMAACQGDRFIGFGAGATFNEAFAQTAAPLIGGQQYTLSACLAVDDLGKAIPFGGPYTGRGTVDVFLNSALIGTLAQNTASLTWEGRSFTFTAPTASTAVFEFVARPDVTAPGGRAPSYMGMDDIACTAVPGPGSLALLGVSGFVTSRRRARR